MKLRKYLKFFVITVIVVLIGSYAYFEGRNLIAGPRLVITSPENGFTSNEPLLNITGNTKNISSITLNDRQIFVNEKGQFKEKILLSHGYNIIEVEVIDKFNRKKQEVLEIVYK